MSHISHHIQTCPTYPHNVKTCPTHLIISKHVPHISSYPNMFHISAHIQTCLTYLSISKHVPHTSSYPNTPHITHHIQTCPTYLIIYQHISTYPYISCHISSYLTGLHKNIFSCVQNTRSVSKGHEQLHLPLLSIKLTGIFGLTWAQGFAVPFKETAFLLFPFAVLDSSQGESQSESKLVFSRQLTFWVVIRN